jgi:hypothetical protein
VRVRSPARAAWTGKESVIFGQTVPAGYGRQGENRGVRQPYKPCFDGNRFWGTRPVLRVSNNVLFFH